MNIRLKKELLEDKNLSAFATKSKNSLGRYNIEKECDIRTCFQRDRDRIIHSKAFRRLMHKTQVFISPEGDHFRTRITHTLEVSQIARTIASSLFLNEDLTEAIALGHDLGHTPFGHLGEEVLNEILKDGFNHNEQSVRVVQKIEKNGNGLNLTKEVLDGILNHRGRCNPSTLEGKIVQISDKIAYINHDIDDAIRAGILKKSDLPRECLDTLGETPREIINFLIRDIIKNSANKNDIIMDKYVKSCMYKLRKFLFDNVYTSGVLAEERKNYKFMLKEIYEYYYNNFDKVPQEFTNICNTGESKERAICDYIAGMTDRYAIKIYEKLIIK
ncbi:deoxyguanosinetriphosphate triphosphohydrolase [[Clostridium] colinum]|uniref:deoxyguanosinetriphosphate triphosphohydrolase n=1 Tax=[Clostridium] colinum TaxID=36835 RepID=UPI0020259FDF|nr:deoxyguanosinetriphosphate triphosphohydrolase [[Clostridium] colinum]